MCIVGDAEMRVYGQASIRAGRSVTQDAPSGLELLEKPFSASQLLTRVREVLEPSV